jgi:hypothetical protein
VSEAAPSARAAKAAKPIAPNAVAQKATSKAGFIRILAFPITSFGIT